MLTYCSQKFLVQYIQFLLSTRSDAFINQAVLMTISNLCNPCISVPIYTHRKCSLPKLLLFWSQLTDTCRQKLMSKGIVPKVTKKNSKHLELNVMLNKVSFKKMIRLFLKYRFRKPERMGGRSRSIPEFKDSLVYTQKPCLGGGREEGRKEEREREGGRKKMK